MSTIDEVSDVSIDTLPNLSSVMNMRTDWLVLEKERLERQKSLTLDEQDMLNECKSELSRRGDPSEQNDFAYEGLFPSGDR